VDLTSGKRTDVHGALPRIRELKNILHCSALSVL